nr:MAG TPA: hypothetical protein [Caudoviricetes sp.]
MCCDCTGAFILPCRRFIRLNFYRRQSGIQAMQKGFYYEEYTHTSL